MKKIQSKKAFVSLFTVLLATVILAIAVGMSSVALKQIVLGITAEESNEAFYSADAGLQCAIMLDIQDTFQSQPGSVSCGEVPSVAVSSNAGSHNFQFDWLSSGNCVRISVQKQANLTRIEALGYNVSCTEQSLGTNPKMVERALRVRYQ